MALIRIQERAGGQDGSNAVVSFDNGPEYSITISDPYTEKEEKELEWYFEEHLAFPFTKKVRAQSAAASITAYGEALFNQVFGKPDVYAEYRALLKSGLNDLQLEIAGSPKFHALHWEAKRSEAFTAVNTASGDGTQKPAASSISSTHATLSHHQPAHCNRPSLWQA